MPDLAPFLKCRDDGRPRLMGIVNVTSDSFHAASRVASLEAAVTAALDMWDAGADWIDIGGESTRPGAQPVLASEEISRVVPVIEALRNKRPNGLISIDTRHPIVAAEALASGANMVNDVSGLRDPEMFNLVLESKCAVCIMHMLGQPGNMQTEPVYNDVVNEVSENLLSTARRLIVSGHSSELITLDPGIGFGKTLEQNLSLLEISQPLRGDEGFSVLWGVSRKTVFRDLLSRELTDERLAGTLGVAAHAMNEGVDILRVHDVEEHHDLLTVLSILRKQSQ
ncbi:MAG TPA: dihydropteroate synthase [Candidatus Poseidoniales archaeon]|nr:MAG: dihydropteroate synthase [Euryarchaeota archaeon]HIA25055.1 dihydropteroate synthase [Candidatus Poseidoniales archaeon]HIN44802.1 dihydropteroate synthase [Candidatus Poseidoniales archaeon]